MEPSKLDLPTVWRGCSYPAIILAWLDAEGNPLNLTGWTPKATSRTIDFHPVISGDPASGITMISLSVSETANVRIGVEAWDWVWVTTGAATPPLLGGLVEIKEPKTKP